jgi:hypothetical protein
MRRRKSHQPSQAGQPVGARPHVRSRQWAALPSPAAPQAAHRFGASPRGPQPATLTAPRPAHPTGLAMMTSANPARQTGTDGRDLLSRRQEQRRLAGPRLVHRQAIDETTRLAPLPRPLARRLLEPRAMSPVAASSVCAAARQALAYGQTQAAETANPDVAHLSFRLHTNTLT